MDINSYQEQVASIRAKYKSMTDLQLAKLATKHRIEHAIVTRHGDYLFLREKIVTKLTQLDLNQPST